MRLSHRRKLSTAIVIVAALVVGSGTAAVVAYERDAGAGPAGQPHPGRTGGARTQPLPEAGAYVPAYDLASDPVFPNLSDGYAIEAHTTGGVTTEHLAESRDGGRSWYLVGAPFPFESGYDEVQFNSLADGYAFGPAGLAFTHDGGREWEAAATLGGALERVIPIGENVWATYAVCTGPPLPATNCAVALGISTNRGKSWVRPGDLPISEAEGGGDILARETTTEAFVVTYGPTGGGLAVTYDSGASWQRLPDPCAVWETVDLAALWPSDLWMVCGGPSMLGASSSPKAVFRSFDGGHHFVLESSTGFAPTTPLAGPTSSLPGGPAPQPASQVAKSQGPFGSIPFAGQLSQLATISPTRAWIGVSGVGVLVTDDSGYSWSLVDGIHDATNAGGVGVTFNDALHGWAIAFHLGVWKTVDGVNWQLVDGA